mgnify:CR=1 FL=1
MPNLAALEAHLATLGRVVLGYSGGVDSALLAVAGRRALGAGNFLAVIGRSASYPEVQYAQAVALARNQGVPLDALTTVNIDFLRQYRPHTNVVTRPVAGTRGQGISLVGHHEILIPLIAAAVIDSAG